MSEDADEAMQEVGLWQPAPSEKPPTPELMADLMTDDPSAWLAYRLLGVKTDWKRVQSKGAA